MTNEQTTAPMSETKNSHKSKRPVRTTGPAVLEITSCSSCPFFERRRMFTEDSWEEAYDWFCKKSNGKKIAGYVEWHEAPKIQVPDWCKLRGQHNHKRMNKRDPNSKSSNKPVFIDGRPTIFHIVMDARKMGLSLDEASMQDLASEYAIVAAPEANGGLIVYGKYRGKWVPNPATRFLIRALLENMGIALPSFT